MATRPLVKGRTGSCPIVSFVFVPELVDALNQRAETTGMSKSAIVRRALEAFLADTGDETALAS